MAAMHKQLAGSMRLRARNARVTRVFHVFHPIADLHIWPGRKPGVVGGKEGLHHIGADFKDSVGQ